MTSIPENIYILRLTQQILGLSIILITTLPLTHTLHRPGIPHIHFTSYTRAEILLILGRNPWQVGGPELAYETKKTKSQKHVKKCGAYPNDRPGALPGVGCITPALAGSARVVPGAQRSGRVIPVIVWDVA